MDKLNDAREQYLAAMGIQLWERRMRDVPCIAPSTGETVAPPMPDTALDLVKPAAIPLSGKPAVSASSEHDYLPAMDVTTLDWFALEQAVSICTRCPLHLTRNRTVFGVGDRQAEWMVIGEAPGADEDRVGEPFVGRAGQLLTAMLKAIGLAREQVFIANILKSRPPGNRDPLSDEVAACEPFLMRQIALVQPRIILVLGRIAAQNLLRTDTKIGLLRGKLHTCPGTKIPLVVTYHPAYLLRSPGEKRKSWEDLKFAVKVLQDGAGR